MSSSVSTTTNGVVVITHVYPAGNGLGMGAPSPPTCVGRVGPVVSSVMERFREGHPKALGTVQIMVGAITFLFGIVMTFGDFHLGVESGIFVWGSIIYTIAGSLTIGAEKSLNKCLVKASLEMNVVATVTAGIGTVLYSVDAAGVFYDCTGYNYNYNNGPLPCIDGLPLDYNYNDTNGSLPCFDVSLLDYNDNSNNRRLCYQYWAQHQGISGIMLVFSLLEMMVSISVSAFACKAVCHSHPEQVFIVGSHFPQGGPVPSQTTFNIPPNSYETLRTPKGPEEGLSAYDNNRPPQYSPAIIP